MILLFTHVLASAEPMNDSNTTNDSDTANNSESIQSDILSESRKTPLYKQQFATDPYSYVHQDEEGYVLIVEGKPFFVKGMNWGYVPIGQNYSYNFWDEEEAFIQNVLDKEMKMLQDMGVNAIRQYPGIPPKWVSYIHKKYGIYTMINPLVGRYGLSIDGQWVPVTNYQDPRTREIIHKDTLQWMDVYKDTDGFLLWLLGNENNYGLHWTSFEIEALPKNEQGKEKAKYLYSLFNELAVEIHKQDASHPVAIANGDLQYIDLVAEYCTDIDIFGSNVYRGISARDLYQRVEDRLGIPVMYTEFGSDAYDAKRGMEDGVSQAYYLHGQWKEIYEQSYGKGKVGNAIGGFTFQWSDGWWKYLQETNLEIHDTNASWPNGGYEFDFVDGQNNMNEEWFGITAKGFPDSEGYFDLFPRPAYFLLKDAYKLDVYASDTDLQKIDEHFGKLNASDYIMQYEASKSAADVEALKKIQIQDLRMEVSTVASASSHENNGLMSLQNMQSAYVTLRSEPVDGLNGELSLNVLGDVASNQIDDIFYENRGEQIELIDAEGNNVGWTDRNRLAIYRMAVKWNHRNFNMHMFYRDGHYHWGNEGDFFNFYQEANYGSNIDIYNANVPFGVSFDFKGAMSGLKIVLGPQIYWGANPTAIAKYEGRLGNWNYALVHQEDFTSQASVSTSLVIPEQKNRRSSLYLHRKVQNVDFEWGGLWSGSPRTGQNFNYVVEAKERSYNNSGYHVVQDQTYWLDTLGTKAKIKTSLGSTLFYAQAGYQGLLADGGGDPTITYTGWRLKNPGRGNNYHGLVGLAYNMGFFQIAPNFLYQKPLIGPNPYIEGGIDNDTGIYYSNIVARNVLADPFQVLGNRETTAVEVLFVYDPTPGSWFWAWNNDVRENAPFAGSIGFQYRHQPTTRDAILGFNEDNVLFAFSGAPPAQDLWEINSRFVFTEGKNRIIGNIYTGTAQARGDDTRTIMRTGVNMRMWYEYLRADIWIKLNDWGPYDYHQDYNLTFPIQTIGDLSFGMKKPRYSRNNPRVGVRGKFRYLDEYSPDYIPNPNNPNNWGHQYEVMTYVHFGI